MNGDNAVQLGESDRILKIIRAEPGDIHREENLEVVAILARAHLGHTLLRV